jgi:MFS family permease
MTEEQTGIRLSPNRMTLVTGVLAYAMLSYSVTSNMLVPLLPALERAYRVSAVTAVWITLTSLLAGAAFIPSLCRLGDTLSWKKSMALAGLACLVLGGVIAALSTTIPLLLVGRALQGVALVVFPMIAGIVNDEFPVVRRKVAISLLSAALFLGTGIGGVLAGLLVEHHGSFRIVFWLSAVLPLIALPLVALTVPRGRRPAGAPANWRQAVDLAGAAGFAIPAIALDIAFSEAPAWGWHSARVITLYVVAAVVAVAWVLVERRLAHPMVDMKVFWSRPIWVNNAVSVLAGFGLLGAAIATATFVQMPPAPGLGGLGGSAVTGALIILPAEWMMLVVGPIVGYLSRRSGKGPFLFGGAVLEGAGLLLVMAFHGSLLEIGLCMAVMGIGVGAVCSSFGLIYVEDVPPEHVGRLFGISPILSLGVGGSIGGSVFAAFLTSNHLPGSTLPSIGAFQGFWALSGALSLLGAAFAAVYLVTYWSGLRGGDRAMVRRPLLEPVAAPVPGAGAVGPVGTVQPD